MKKMIISALTILAVALSVVGPTAACGGHDKDAKKPAPAPAPSDS